MQSFIRVLLFSCVIGYLVTACQPGALTKKSAEVPVDSTLYFQPVEVEDTFMDTVFSLVGRSASLKLQVIPPPAAEPEPPRFRETEGFRVQIFAGLDSINAVPIVRQTQEISRDSIYLFKEKGLFKIQVGDYQYRYMADSANMSLRKNGFPGAWVVKRTIRLPLEAGQPTGPVNLQPSDSLSAESVTPPTAGRFKIQVMATSTVERAQSLVNDLSKQYKVTAYYEKAGSLYKVYVGPFTDEVAGRQMLEQIRKTGYPDAWLVY
jgi:hypothetical protein